MKDNVFLMEKLMRQELRNEYERAITERDNELKTLKESFAAYKSELNNQIKEEVAIRITETSQEVKNMVQKKKFAVMRGHTMKEANGGRMVFAGQHDLQTGIDMFEDDPLTPSSKDSPIKED